jgi:purine-cytosine permease-like protein
MRALGLQGGGALLLALGTITTNFVNIYMSALAWKSLFPAARDSVSVGAIGLAGAGLSLLDRAWLDRYTAFMALLGGLLVPVSGIVFARYFLLRRAVRVEELYDAYGPYADFDRAALAAWILGAATYFAAAPIGGTVPCLLVAVAVYGLLAQRG